MKTKSALLALPGVVLLGLLALAAPASGTSDQDDPGAPTQVPTTDAPEPADNGRPDGAAPGSTTPTTEAPPVDNPEASDDVDPPSDDDDHHPPIPPTTDVPEPADNGRPIDHGGIDDLACDA